MNRPFRRLAAAALLPLLLAGCRRGDEDGTIHLNGRIEAAMVDLAPKVPGRVLEVRVREGDRVKAGDLLVTLDLGETALSVDRDRDALGSAEARLSDLRSGSRSQEVAAAEADLADKRAIVDLARRELGRQEALMAKKVGIPRELAREGARRYQTEQARSDVRRAETVLKQSQTVAREAEIRAPADGVILHRMAEPGLLLGAGQPALSMAFADRLYVRTFVPETKLGQVRPGVAARVVVDAFPGRSFPARVTEISPVAEFTPKAVETREERVNLVYAAKVDLDRGWGEPLVPGQPAEVLVEPLPTAPSGSTRPRSVPSASLR
jgi:HlyD family secretion protein